MQGVLEELLETSERTSVKPRRASPLKPGINFGYSEILLPHLLQRDRETEQGEAGEEQRAE